MKNLKHKQLKGLSLDSTLEMLEARESNSHGPSLSKQQSNITNVIFKDFQPRLMKILK
jgi:hypothetical protein